MKITELLIIIILIILSAVVVINYINSRSNVETLILKTQEIKNYSLKRINSDGEIENEIHVKENIIIQKLVPNTIFWINLDNDNYKYVNEDTKEEMELGNTKQFVTTR